MMKIKMKAFIMTKMVALFSGGARAKLSGEICQKRGLDNEFYSELIGPTNVSRLRTVSLD
jgi:hypothetical protein